MALFFVLSAIYTRSCVSSGSEGELSIGVRTKWEIEDYQTPVPTRAQAGAILDNYLYLFGGLYYDNENRDVFRIDLLEKAENMEWETIAYINDTVMPQPWFASNKGASVMTDIDDYGIYITCEDSRDGHIWRFDTEDDLFEFEVIATMQDSGINYKIEDCCSVAVEDSIYIFGGAQYDSSTDSFFDVNYTQIYDVESDEWMYGADLPLALQDTTCEAYDDRYIYVFGGSNGDTVQDDAYRYDIKNDEWSTYSDVLSVARRSFGAVTVTDTNYIILTGGDTDGQSAVNHTFLNLVEAFNVETNEIEDVGFPQLNFKRSGAIALIDNGEIYNGNGEIHYGNKIYIIGGEYVVDTGVFNTTETLVFSVKIDDADQATHIVVLYNVYLIIALIAISSFLF